MPFNKSRTLQYMKECHLDALIVTSAVNVGYLSGYFCWLDSLFMEYMSRPGASSNLPESYAVVTRDGDVVLLVNSLWAANTHSLADVAVRTFGKADLDFAETQPRSGNVTSSWILCAARKGHVRRFTRWLTS